MTRYLTNTELHNEALCLEAAKNSGFDVRFNRYPMPRDIDDFWMEEDDCYHPEALVGTYGCVETFEPMGRDHSPFWREWDRLKALGKPA